MKRFCGIVFILTLFVTIFTGTAFASENITVDLNMMNIVVDGERVFADNFVYQNTTYVPLRRIAEMLGKEVVWDASINGAMIKDSVEKKVTDSTRAGLSTQKSKILSVDKNTINIYVNNTKVEADNFVYEDRTYVPLRRISEMLNKEVNWERVSNTASIGARGISIFDGKVIGKIGDVEYTQYVCDYYNARFTEEAEYYESIGEDSAKIMGGTVEDCVNNQLRIDYTLINYAINNGLSMTPMYNSAYYDSVSTTMKGVKNDPEKFQRMLEMQGFTSLNAYYYAMLISDLYLQYAEMFTATDAEMLAHYNSNEELNSIYSYSEALEIIDRNVKKNKADEKLKELSKNVVINKY